uniref:Reverse transcriptase Ty1/copia-type domain-containing protein n=1 Tax=Solanum lycopersicum TaxID=4081 RepID=A0A3Q7FYT6_SOLLC
MTETKVVSTLLAKHFKLSTSQSPSTNEEKNEMLSIPYSSAVGSLMYAMICTRPDIPHVVGIVSRFLSTPGKEHLGKVKWILRYLKGGAISCQVRLQKCIALSTIEAEYIVITEGTKEFLWMKEFIKYLVFEQS